MQELDTLQKGVIGRTKIIADLTAQGFEVNLPVSESLSYDMIVHKDGKFLRIQARYISLRNGVIRMAFRTVHQNRQGNVLRQTDKNLIDIFAVYCPDVDRCFYVDPKEFGSSCWLRVVPAPIKGDKYNLAEDYSKLLVAKTGFEPA